MKVIFVPTSKEEINHYFDDVNYELKGVQHILNNKNFATLWKCDILGEFLSLIQL